MERISTALDYYTTNPGNIYKPSPEEMATRKSLEILGRKIIELRYLNTIQLPEMTQRLIWKAAIRKTWADRNIWSQVPERVLVSDVKLKGGILFGTIMHPDIPETFIIEIDVYEKEQENG